MNRKEYTAAVLKGLRHLTEGEEAAIRMELDGHIEDHMLSLMEHGYEPAEAEEKAVACMGEAAELSRELQKCYSYGWLIAQRVLGLLLVLLLLGNITTVGVVMRGVWQNLQVRLDPMSHLSDSAREDVRQELDIELDCGQSMLKFYAMGENERGEPVVYYAIRSKRLLGYVADNIQIEYYAPGDLTEELRGGGGHFSNARVRYGNDNLELPEGANSILAVVSCWGEEQRVELPIAWEVAA